MNATHKHYLIFGADGMLGTDFADRLKDQCQPMICPQYRVKNPGEIIIDITDRNKVFEAVVNFHPKVVINAAAFTDVDGCETNFDYAFDVNGTAVGYIAAACNEAGAKLVHISTDYVFDGKKGTPYLETDHLSPISKYGRTKAEGEHEAKKAKNHLIVRTAWLFGAHGKNFATAIIKNSKEKGELSVVDDQIGSPTYTMDLIEAILKLVKTDAKGIYNVTNSGGCSWYEYSKKIIELSGMPHVKVNPIKTEESNRSASRPKYSILNMDKFEKKTGFKMRPWQSALKTYMTYLHTTTSSN